MPPTLITRDRISRFFPVLRLDGGDQPPPRRLLHTILLLPRGTFLLTLCSLADIVGGEACYALPFLSPLFWSFMLFTGPPLQRIWLVAIARDRLPFQVFFLLLFFFLIPPFLRISCVCVRVRTLRHILRSPSKLCSDPLEERLTRDAVDVRKDSLPLSSM